MIPVLGSVAGGLLLLSGLLSAVEAATFAVGPSRLRTLVEEGFNGAEPLATVRARDERTAVVLLLGNTVLNALAIGALVMALGEPWGLPGAAAGVVAGFFLVLLVGEIVPRTLASRHPIRIALTAAPALLFLERLLLPLFVPAEAVARLFVGRPDGTEPHAAIREVRELAALGRKEGLVDERERQMAERVFRLDELNAWDVMTPRVDVFAWPDARRLADIIDDLGGVPYSRVPVYGESVDEITGILYLRDAYQAWVAGKKDVALAELSREPFFIPGSIPALQLLGDFQARRIHMGIVADEFGGTDGLVTLEDILEELVGEIVDETDIDEEPLTRISRDEIIVDGGIELREVNHAFNVTLPHLEHRSLNGYILEELGRVPEKGETFRRDGVLIEVLEASETQMTRARLRKIPSGGDDGEDGEEAA